MIKKSVQNSAGRTVAEKTRNADQIYNDEYMVAGKRKETVGKEMESIAQQD